MSAVDHPAHYGGAENPYEAIKVIEAWGAGFHVGSALKYLARCGRKPGADPVEDLRKARWYLERRIELLERERTESAEAIEREQLAKRAELEAEGLAVTIPWVVPPAGLAELEQAGGES